MRDEVQLIAYADRLGGSLPALGRLLDGPLAGLFGGVHLLPFFLPYDGADAGYDPVDHLSVDPRLGGWEDVARLGRDRDLVVDLIVNHVSVDSAPFRDVQQRGDASAYSGMFLTFDRIFPAGTTEADLVRIVRPRPGLPFTPMVLGGRRRLVWTTFTSRQADLDVHHPQARRYLSAVLRRLADCGVAMVRLDAVGYAVKTAGSSCFLTPETIAFLDEIAAEAHRLGLAVLTEVHAPHRYALELAGRVDRGYDFALAPLVLHALFTGDGDPLRGWLARRPRNAVTVLDTHDGIGLVDAGPDLSDGGDPGLLAERDLTALATRVVGNSGGRAEVLATPAGGLYRVDCTLYDALGADDRRFLLARLIQLCTPGVPQVYYVGLLAGRNAVRLPAGADGREINRPHYTEAEVSRALGHPVVRALVRLIRFRNAHPAFAGDFGLPAAPAGQLVLAWRSGTEQVRVTVRLADAGYEVGFSTGDGWRVVTDLADLPDSGLLDRDRAR